MSAIRAAWQKVFVDTDPFAWPFRPEFPTGRIFYPTAGYHLAKPQFEALTKAMEAIGESSFLVSIVESEEGGFPREGSEEHWECTKSNWEEYARLPIPLENALYSMEGQWGILVSHEMHALVAGSKAFISALTAAYGEWSADLIRLQEAWKDNPNAGWLEPAISRTRGS